MSIKSTPTHKLALLLSLFLLASISSVLGEEDASIKRLEALGKLWAEIKYFHPYLAYREINWDAALVGAIPKAEVAKDAAEYAAAVEQLLDPLNDPATAVVKKSDPGLGADRSPRAISSTKTEEGILVIEVPPGANFADDQAKLTPITKLTESSNGVVIDLRSTVFTGQYFSYLFASSGLNGWLCASAVQGPGHRARLHSGYARPDRQGSGGYFSGFYTTNGQEFPPSPKAKEQPIVFVVNEKSGLPPVAAGLQSVGKALIVSEGGFSDASLARLHRVRLPYDVVAVFRLTEPILPDGSGLEPDVTVPFSGETDGDRALQTALELAKNFRPERFIRDRPPAVGRHRSKPANPDLDFPEVEYRLLAAFEIWGVFTHFFAYNHLMEGDWDSVLREFTPRMEEAGNALEYHLAVAEMIAHAHDSHVRASSQVLTDFFGEASPPIQLRWVENAAVVAGLVDEPIANETGIKVGDVVLEIDGRDVASLLESLKRYFSASTEQSLMYELMRHCLKGPEDSSVGLLVLGQNDRRKLRLPRKKEFAEKMRHQRGGEVLRMLEGNVGYADLDRLPRSDVDKMFEKFKDTRAIVFDMRGYPLGTAWSIAPRLTEETTVEAARFERPVWMGPGSVTVEGLKGFTRFTFFQSMPWTNKWRYKGKTVMLVDERTRSQAEHTGLFLRAANGTKFVGSHSAGANGDVTNFKVPGGIQIRFSGHDVRHVDGRQLQRIGLVPDIEVKPSIQGLREARDEVLERALGYLLGPLGK